VAVVVAGLIAALPHAMVLVAWISASAVGAGVATWRELRGHSGPLRALGVGGVLLFIPTIADLVLANVTIALVVAAWIAIRGGRLRSGIALGLLAAAFPKPFLIPIGLWLIVWRRRSAAGAVVSGAIAVVISTLAAGIGPWGRFVETLASGGGLALGFVGNYGVSALAPGLAIWVAIAAAALFLWLLVRRQGEGASLAGAAAAGIFVAPYAGIYAALPLLLAARHMAAVRPRVTAIVAAIAIVTAPWAIVPGALTMLIAMTLGPRPARDGGPGSMEPNPTDGAD
jgi:hypothetical protein